jgi:hypothetical protein
MRSRGSGLWDIFGREKDGFFTDSSAVVEVSRSGPGKPEEGCLAVGRLDHRLADLELIRCPRARTSPTVSAIRSTRGREHETRGHKARQRYGGMPHPIIDARPKPVIVRGSKTSLRHKFDRLRPELVRRTPAPRLQPIVAPAPTEALN